MSLNAQQKDALSLQLAELLDQNEPTAFLASLHRIAERQAWNEARARANYEQAIHWQDIADAVSRVGHELAPQSFSDRPKTHA